jgi:hypothetical protein
VGRADCSRSSLRGLWQERWFRAGVTRLRCGGNADYHQAAVGLVLVWFFCRTCQPGQIVFGFGIVRRRWSGVGTDQA